MNLAFACRLIEENYGAIASEKPGFDLEETRQWVKKHGDGFFIRDEEKKQLDCCYLTDAEFHQTYLFDNFQATAIFHRLLRI